jgi:hypothetical protein
MAKKNKLTKAHILNLGWIYSKTDKEYYIPLTESYKYCLYIDDKKKNIIHLMWEAIGMGDTLFFGRLITNNPQKELKQLMLQVGIPKQPPETPPQPV